MSTRKLVLIALIGSLAAVLMWFQFPLLPQAPFLEYDFSDIAVLTGTFSMGPAAGFLIATIKVGVFFLTKGKSGPIGALMNWTSTVLFVLVAGLFYWYLRRDRWGALGGMILGTVVFTATMVFMNIYVALPLWGIPAEEITGLVKAAVVPFNLLRGLISTTVTFLFYKKASAIISGVL